MLAQGPDRGESKSCQRKNDRVLTSADPGKTQRALRRTASTGSSHFSEPRQNAESALADCLCWKNYCVDCLATLLYMYNPSSVCASVRSSTFQSSIKDVSNDFTAVSNSTFC